MQYSGYNINRSDRIFVTGHINPDTDSIASAIGYAWLLHERDNLPAVACRAGSVNLQTSWVLKTLELDPPVLLTDASPRFESVTKRYDVATPEKSLNDAWAILTRTGGIAPIVNTDGTPYGMVTGQSVFDFLRRIIGPHPKYRDMTISQLLDIPSREAAKRDIPRFQPQTRIKDVINRLLRHEFTEYWVVDDSGRYLGVVRQNDLLHPPRIKVVLVDHNEPQQSIASLEEAELLEILDHHRLGNRSTHVPIKFTVDIVGSTSTLVGEQIVESGLSAPPKIAGMLMAGLLSDTLIFQSPTTTQRDKAVAETLARWAFVPGSPLENETIQSYGEKVVRAGAGLLTREPDNIVNGDVKSYESAGFKFAISQVEVAGVYDLGDILGQLRKALIKYRDANGLDFAMLMITDVVEGSSRLLMVEQPPALEELPYRVLQDGTFSAEGVVSRKKQLLPQILSLLEE